MAGILSIVATPIGNLEDITLRAMRVLQEATVIACEDTRHSRTLLDHIGAHARLLSYHEHNEAERTQDLLALLERGERVALISDAGTPLLSDPGYRIVRAAIDAGIPVDVVPGPSALLTAIAGSGIGCSTFFFGGFLPAKRQQRAKSLEDVASLDTALVFYEAPHRIAETLEEIARLLPNRELCLARELTKLHEEWLRGSPAEVARTVAARASLKGEVVLVLGRPTAAANPDEDLPLEQAVARAMEQGASRMDAIKQVAKARGLPKRTLYQMLEGNE